MLFPVMVFVSRKCSTEYSRSRIPLKVIRQSLWMCAILSLPAYAILWNTTHILMLTGQPPALAQMAGRYMDYYLWAIFPIFARCAFAMALTAMHRTGIIAIITWLEVVLNIILDYGLIFGEFGFPAMGIAGAGLASIIVYGIGHTAFFFSIFDFRRFFKSLELLIINAIFSVFALLSGWIGIQALAANTIALQTTIMVSYTLPWAVADIVTVRVSAALARKSHAGMWVACIQQRYADPVYSSVAADCDILGLSGTDCRVVCRLRDTEAPGAFALGILADRIGWVFRDCRRFPHRRRPGIERPVGYESANVDRGAGLLGDFPADRRVARIYNGLRCPGILDRADARRGCCRSRLSGALSVVGASALS